MVNELIALVVILALVIVPVVIWMSVKDRVQNAKKPHPPKGRVGHISFKRDE